MRAALAIALLSCCWSSGCAGGDGEAVGEARRSAHRAYDGAPPVVPHPPFGSDCLSCHGEKAMELADLGIAPPSPHAPFTGAGSVERCQQCHVFRVTDELFVESTFEGLRPPSRSGSRAHAHAPPTVPHRQHMRERCLACHGGPAAIAPLATSHPERDRCGQCHVDASAPALAFERRP